MNWERAYLKLLKEKQMDYKRLYEDLLLTIQGNVEVERELASYGEAENSYCASVLDSILQQANMKYSIERRRKLDD